MMLERLCLFCKGYFHITWTRTTSVICVLPFILCLTVWHLVAIVLQETYGAIVTNTPLCAKIGKEIIKEGGSAVDAVVAAMICEGVCGPKEVGIGGGFTALLYMNGQMESLIATPTVPEKSPIDEIERKDELTPAMAGGIPGELLGYWKMHQKYGLMPWKRLILPSVKMAYDGIDISESQFLETVNRSKRNVESKEYLYPESKDGFLKSPILGRTLEQIAEAGADIFYKGELGKAFVEDIQKAGGILTMNDLKNYNVSWSDDVIFFRLPHGLRVFTTPLPSSGVIVAFAMNIIKGYSDVKKPVFWHRVIEALKHAVGRGLTLGDLDNEPNVTIADNIRRTYTKMLDMDYAREIRKQIFDDGILNSSNYGGKFHQVHIETSNHISVLAPNGDAVCLTSSLSVPFDGFLSKNTGIYWNDQLRSFHSILEETPPGRRIIAGKRFLMSHAPTIVLQDFKSKPVFMLGATGGPYMPTQIVMALTRFCLMVQSIHKAINSGYLHPHMGEKTVEIDDDNSQAIVEYLYKLGHKLNHLGDRILDFGTAAIANFHNRPIPEISKRQIGGEAQIEPEHYMAEYVLGIIVFLLLWILAVFIKDYFELRNHFFYVNDQIYVLPY